MMKTVAVVSLLYLPGTFVSVSTEHRIYMHPFFVGGGFY